MLMLSVIMGAVCTLFHTGAENWAAGGGFFGELARLGAAIAVGVLILAGGLRMIDLPESRFLFSRRRRPSS
jgi:hypothetical protein